MPSVEERLQAQLAALVGDAVDRVVQQHGLPADALLSQLQAAQLEASQLRQELAEVQAVDDAELKRLWGTIGELSGCWPDRLGWNWACGCWPPVMLSAPSRCSWAAC